MIGAFLIRGLVMVFGYAYPSYECYKVVDKNRPDIEQLRFWCQYWILIAMLTIFERVADTFVSWVPMYGEAKLFFIIYLWYPKTKGTTFVYDSFFRPYIAKHEVDIDRNLLELRTRAGDFAVLHWQKAANYGRTRVVDILQYVASQSTPKPRSTQLSHQGSGVRQSTAAFSTEPSPTKEKPSMASSIGVQEELKEDESRSEVSTEAPSAAALNAQKSTGTQVTQPLAGSSKTTTSHGEAMPIESASF